MFDDLFLFGIVLVIFPLQNEGIVELPEGLSRLRGLGITVLNCGLRNIIGVYTRNLVA